MIVKWPEKFSDSSRIVEEPVISTDFYPSLLEMAGLPARDEQALDGVSFVPALNGDSFNRGPIFWHFPQYSNHGMQSPGGAVRFGDYKLLEYFENNTVQLFNLREDIGERNDLSKTEPQIREELRTLLRSWREDVDAQMPPRNPDYDPSQYLSLIHI